MKDFEFINVEDFLEVADGLTTPFKFIETETFGNKVVLDAKVWLRSAFISFHHEGNKEETDKIMEILLNHGFNRVKIKETAIQIK